MPMLPTSRRAFVRKHFSPHLDRRLLALEGSDLIKLAASLNRPPDKRRLPKYPLTDLTEKKEHLEWAIALLAAEVWFESVAPDPRKFEERLSAISDHASKLAILLKPQSRPDLISDYFRYLYHDCLLHNHERPAPEINDVARAVGLMADLGRGLSRKIAPYADGRQRHDLGLKSYLLSLVSVARETRAGVSLPTKEQPLKPTSFTDFALDALKIGVDRSIMAIERSSYLPDRKSEALEMLEGYRAMSLPTLTSAVRRLRHIKGGQSRDMVDKQILWRPEHEPAAS